MPERFDAVVVRAGPAGEHAAVAEAPVERLWHAVPSFPTVSEVWLHMLEATASSTDERNNNEHAPDR